MRFGIAFNLCNYKDWERFLAMERGEEVGPPEVEDEVILAEQIALAEQVEDLGYDSLWTFEMHGSPGLMCPDPHQWLTYFAARTKHIDFGSMITVLPFHNPVRLAEQIALLQHFMGRGRQYKLGVGRGLSLRNFEAVGVPMDEARERFVEVLEVLRLAFTEEVFSYEGKHYQYDNVTIRPRPLDPSTVVEAWGSWTSEPSVRLMGSLGMHPLTSTNKTVESYIHDLDLLNEVRGEHGFGVAERPVLQLPFYCCESEQEAREGAAQFFTEWVDSIMKLYEIGTDRFANAKGYEQYKTTGSDFGSGSYDDAVQVLSKKFQEVGLVGTPEQCAEKVRWHAESMNPQEIVVVSGPGDQRGEAAGKSMRLFAEQVLPRLDDIRTKRGEPVPA